MQVTSTPKIKSTVKTGSRSFLQAVGRYAGHQNFTESRPVLMSLIVLQTPSPPVWCVMSNVLRTYLVSPADICHSDGFITACIRVDTHVIRSECHIVNSAVVSHPSSGKAFIRTSNLGLIFKTLSNSENDSRNFNIKAWTIQSSSQPDNLPNFA
jgi:hypothetical protein